LRTPASATQIASELSLGRQRVNYHLRALEAAGLVELVEERQQRGCIERILAVRSQAFVVDPSMLRGRRSVRVKAAAQDRFAAGHLIDTAASIVRDVARMQTNAERGGTRLLVFTLDTEVGFATPADFERFTTALAAFVTQESAKYETPGGRRYRIIVGSHPAARKSRAGVASRLKRRAQKPH
jgi:DNA-binding transcriptional ArsR family regulator